MSAFRPIAAMLFVGVLAAASAGRAEAAMLLPDLASIVDGDAESDTSMTVSIAVPLVPVPEPAIPLPFDFVASTVPSPVIPSTGSVPVTAGTGGTSALPAATSDLVGSELVDSVQCEHRCGWTQLYRAGVFRPPRNGA
ncbi:MAG: hypothetical protein WBC44_16085 [Planctomycetaceae bacterium]